jgi:hypothetical protein
MRNASLVAIGENQDLEGWRQLERALRATVRDVSTAPNPLGAGQIAAGAMLIACAIVAMVAQPVRFAQEMHEMLLR